MCSMTLYPLLCLHYIRRAILRQTTNKLSGFFLPYDHSLSCAKINYAMLYHDSQRIARTEKEGQSAVFTILDGLINNNLHILYLSVNYSLFGHYMPGMRFTYYTCQERTRTKISALLPARHFFDDSIDGYFSSKVAQAVCPQLFAPLPLMST